MVLPEDLRPVDIQPLGILCRRQAERQGDAIAMWDGDRAISWRDLDRNATRVAHGLAALGVQPGQRIAVLGRTSIEMFEIVHGCAWAGAVYTGVNWRLSAEEIRYIIADSDAEILFLPSEMWEQLAPLRSDLGSIRTVIVFDDAAAPAIAPDTTSFGAWRDAQSDTLIEWDIDPAAPIAQVYTSGTTGHPKGAVLSHRYWMTAAALLCAQEHDTYSLREGEVLLHHMPMFHIGGIGLHYYPAIRGGGIVILKDYAPGEVLRLLGEHRVPLLYGVPSMFQALLNDARFYDTDFSGIRYCSYGAAPMPLALRDRLMAAMPCKFTQRYGMTESAFVTSLDPDDHLGDAPRAASVGRPFKGVEINILDTEGRGLGPGEVGEVAIRTPLMIEGYWKLPEATRAAFRDGWYLTGDGGYLDSEGYLFLKDRIKDLIISGGENISSLEIENALYRHPAVLQTAVVAAADERWGEVPKAFIVTKPGETFDPEALHAFVSNHLGRYKLPKYYEQLDVLPMNASGKILKRELREIGNENSYKVRTGGT